MRCVFRGNDLIQKIDRTVCRYKGTPYYCKAVGNDKVELSPVHNLTNPYTIIHVNDDDFDVSSLPLGYFQKSKTTVCFVERKPIRRWKQGIDSQGIKIFGISQDDMKHHPEQIFCQGFTDSIENKFPDCHQGIAILRKSVDKDMEIAISRDVALKWICDLQVIHVYYRMKIVGMIPIDSHTVFIPSNDISWIITRYLSSFNWEVR